MKLNKSKKGISLIVLVITIIVMIILASAVILSLNSSNITRKAKEAVTASDIANATHVVSLACADWNLMTDEEKVEAVSIKAYGEQKLKEAGYDVGNEFGQYGVSDTGYLNVYKQPVIPNGFVASIYEGETKLSEGFVIYQVDSLDGIEQLTAQKSYNQFVWIPVPNMYDFVRTEFDYKYGLVGDKFKSLSEPYIPDNLTSLTVEEQETVQFEITEYNEMLASVRKYGGFYIGRYEAGDGDTASARTYTQKGVTVAHTVVCKKEAHVYNYVPWGTSMTDITPTTLREVEDVAGAVELARGMINSHSVKSNLTYGVQWDAAVNFIKGVKNSNANPTTGETEGYYEDYCLGMAWEYYTYNYGPEKNIEHIAGKDLTPTQNVTYEEEGYDSFNFNIYTNKVKNIYDLAGNVHEWTMEAYTASTRVFRGGGYNGDGAAISPAYRKAATSTVLFSADIGFRVCMYLV